MLQNETKAKRDVGKRNSSTKSIHERPRSRFALLVSESSPPLSLTLSLSPLHESTNTESVGFTERKSRPLFRRKSAETTSIRSPPPSTFTYDLNCPWASRLEPRFHGIFALHRIPFSSLARVQAFSFPFPSLSLLSSSRRSVGAGSVGFSAFHRRWLDENCRVVETRSSYFRSTNRSPPPSRLFSQRNNFARSCLSANLQRSDTRLPLAGISPDSQGVVTPFLRSVPFAATINLNRCPVYLPVKGSKRNIGNVLARLLNKLLQIAASV